MWKGIARDFRKNKQTYLLALPMILLLGIFSYAPMYGVVIAFQDFSVKKGVMASPWVGLKHFELFFSSPYFSRILGNTLSISIKSLLFGFWPPILLALLLNEVRAEWFKRTIQTLSYLPHFVATVVVVSFIKLFTGPSGVIPMMAQSLFGIQLGDLMGNAKYFQAIVVISGIWQGIGFSSIIYIAAISGVDPQLYEAAVIDGAGRFRQAVHVTLPAILPAISILLILAVGGIMNVGSEKILLMYSPLTYETGDVISTYVYRSGLEEGKFSFSTAVGLFNTIVNLILLTGANWITRRLSEYSLW